MRNRISNRTKERYKDSMSNVIEGLSRKVQVHKQPVKHECPNCYFDRMTGKSTGKCKWTLSDAINMQADYEISNPGVIMYKYFVVGRCPICKGDGYLETKRRVFVDCLVTWNPVSRFNNNTTFTAAGSEGSVIVQLKTSPVHAQLFEECVRVVIDGIECIVEKPVVSRGLGNSTVLVVSAFTNKLPNKSNNSTVKDYK